MEQTNRQSKTLAKNTIVMYCRMALLTIIYFYTSRILLKRLGIDDFGIFSLVGSVVAVFESIKVLFTSSTQRFFNYVMGENDSKKLCTVFNTSIYINTVIAVGFVILVEIAGIWFLNNKANISPDRMAAAKTVFQLSLFSTVAYIVTTAYDAAVIAHEKMGFYAVMSLMDGVMKLVAVLVLPFMATDGLVFYGVSVFAVTLAIRIATIAYCVKNFPECRLKKVYDRSLLKHMVIFAGWQFFGNAAFTVTQNGLNMLLNMFGSTAVNTARGLAYQVRSAVNMFINNVTVVVNPAITRNCAQGNTGRMYGIMFCASKVVFILDLLLVVPLLFATHDVLYLWLGEVPAYAVRFLQILLLNTLVSGLHQQIDIIFKAVGKLKYYQICEGILLLMPVILSYFGLKYGMPKQYVFVLVMVFEILDVAAISLIAKKVALMDVKAYLHSVILPCVVLTAFTVAVWYAMQTFLSLNFAMKIVFALLTDILCVVYMLYAGFTKSEKQTLNALLASGRFAFLARFIK
ncbi:MAG: hypothetical protein IJ250_04425 [Bacteroidales bacterium]|nr:hypothetical protein [Bacteroidales bacterium]